MRTFEFKDVILLLRSEVKRAGGNRSLTDPQQKSAKRAAIAHAGAAPPNSRPHFTTPPLGPTANLISRPAIVLYVQAPHIKNRQAVACQSCR